MAGLERAIGRLITSFHILHHQNVFNEGGSISIRNPTNSATFITSNRPTVLISSPADLNERYVANGSLVQQASDGMPSNPSHHSDPEIYVHSCLYDRYPAINCVIHSPATDFIVYGLCNAGGSMARSVFNNAGFVDEYSPIFDPTDFYATLPPAHPENLLIDDQTLGNALADALNIPIGGFEPTTQEPTHKVAFVRGNGAVLWSSTLEGAVHRVVNLMRNSSIQTAAMMQRGDSDLQITYLSERESAACMIASSEWIQLAWTAWATEVSKMPLYHNEVRVEI